jgi:hypothetical protein
MARVEVPEVVLRDLARPQFGDFVAPFAGCLLGPDIRRFADVVRVRTRRVDAHATVQAGIAHHLPKHALRRWRTADVSHADKEDFGHRFAPF